MKKSFAVSALAAFAVASSLIADDAAIIEKARASMARGSKWLVSRQSENGSWSNEISIIYTIPTKKKDLCPVVYW